MKGKTFYIGLLFIALTSLTAAAETITLVADEWPPFNAKPDSDAEGYMVDIARAVFEAKGISVEYRNMPWKRALVGTRSGNFTGAIGASKNDAQGFIFPEEELARNVLSFYVRKGDSWRFNGLESIKEIRIGTIGGYDYRRWLNDYIQANIENSDKVQVIMGDAPLERNIQKLLAGRVDVVVDTEASIRWVAKRLGVLDEIEAAGYGKEPSYCYIAFSPGLPKSPMYAKLLSNGIVELRANGKLQKILDKYGVFDWKPGQFQ